MKAFIPCTNLSFCFSLRPINLHQLSPQKNAEICLSLVLGRFWPWLPCKSSTLFSLLPSQPYHSLTSFLQPIHISFQFRGVSSFYYLPLSPPPPNPFPSNSSRSSINLSHLQEGLLSIYQFQVRYKLKFINILLKYYQLLDNFSSVSRWRNIPVL